MGVAQGVAQIDHDVHDITCSDAHIVLNAVNSPVEYVAIDQSTESGDPPVGRLPDVCPVIVEFDDRFRERLPAHSRADSRRRRAHRWPPGQRVPGSRPVRGAYVCCPESLVVQCGDLRRPSAEEPGGFPRGFGPVGESPNTAREEYRDGRTPKEILHGCCNLYGSRIGRHEGRPALQHAGKGMQLEGVPIQSQPEIFDKVLAGVCARKPFFQADEHPSGHPSGAFLDRCQHRSYFHPLQCQISYGPTQPSLSVAGSVGECLTDIAVSDTHAHAQACVGGSMHGSGYKHAQTERMRCISADTRLSATSLQVPLGV